MKKKLQWLPPYGGNPELKLFLRKMKLTLIFTMLVFLTFGNGFSQVKVSLHFEKATIQQVMKSIEEQTGHVFLYKDGIFDPSSKYSVNFTDVPFDEVLNSVCETAGVQYEVRSNRQIILTEKGKEEILTVAQQQKTVTGVVTDPRGEPLPGVTVLVNGTTVGTITDSQGKFTLAVPASAEELQFSFVGMKTQHILLSGRNVFTVVMEEESLGVDEVIVVGYGTQKKSDITGSVTSVPRERLAKLPVTNVMQAVQGAVSGVQVTQTSSIPGESPAVVVRGGGSITASNSPYVIVDGIPITKMDGSVNDINPNDIESIEILKDASAVAIYGMNGATGSS